MTFEQKDILNKFQNTQNHQINHVKRQNTVKQTKKNESYSKRRSLPIKIFAKAHQTQANQTFLTQSVPKLKKNAHHQNKKYLTEKKVQNKNNHKSIKQTKKTNIENQQQQINTSDLIGSMNNQQFKIKIKEVQKKVINKQSLTKQGLSESTKIFYGEEGACWQDKTFKIVDQSTISLKQQGNFLGLNFGKNNVRCSISFFNQKTQNQKI